MAKWTQAAREAYHKESPENFAGPDMSFPIRDGSDVADAWGLAGHADSPDAVRAKIKAIAKRLGLESSLPDTAKDDTQDRSMDTTTTEVRTQDAPVAMQASDRLAMSLPLVRIDSAKREVWGQATAEVPDSYGTIFGYCPEAWTKWRGNIREQHDPKKAVGKAVEINPDPQERAIYVGSRVSRGAQDTWLKVEDNVLSGYSASIIPDPEFGPDPARWPKKEYNGKQYPYLPRYIVAELSLVDNPACPGCNIQIVRADGFATEVLDLTEEEVQEEIPPASPEHLERAGARVSSSTRDTMHSSIGHTLRAAHAQMSNCGCKDCVAAMKLIDPDADGDIDMGGYDDPDQDWQSLYGNNSDIAERMLSGLIERVLEQKISAVYTRLQGIAGTLARSNATPNLESIVTGAITRALEAASAASAASLSEVHADLSAVKETVARIEATPMPGAPVMNTSALPRPVEKRLVTDPYAMPRTSGSAVADAVAAMSAAGQLNTVEDQVNAVAAALAAQRRG